MYIYAMHSRLSLAAVAIASCLSTFTFAQIPPRFSPSSSEELVLSFGSTSIVPGQQIGINVPALPPKVASTTPLEGTYLLSLQDPDAMTPAAPTIAQYLHWLQPGLNFSSTPNSTDFPATIPASATVPYARPQPPPISPAHRYIALLFAQPLNFSIPVAFQGFNATNRMKFNISVFAAEAGLGAPVAANYFLVSNMTVTNVTNATGTGPSVPAFTGGTGKIMLSLWVLVTGVIGGLTLVF